ncbi:MAG TPA: beta-galactosidase [Aggregatilinea sp.]|uniref:beta-galactosidase n=1 Tax=Aggregatilinea sp. TaxID=2806333 RepID=UPI002C2E0D12|nr:beta-galactosidase [Aggregatilinea sp.]HML24692.1 beta-galactosidase [Aggregatilinea sp.]
MVNLAAVRLLLLRLRRPAALIARLLILGAVLRALAPAPFRVTLDPPQTVETEHPVVCMHTRLTDEVEEWKIQHTLQLVREMGASTIVEYFPWPYVEAQRGTYDWSHPDRIIQHAANQGLQVIARLGLAPDWTRPPVDEKVTTFTYLTDDYYDEFAAFAGAFAARYQDELLGIIIWNEPNLSFEWGGRPVDPESYTDLLRQSSDAIHASAPGVLVMGGALAPTIEPEDSGSSMNDIRYLERMYEAGAAGTFDALAVHTYGFTLPPDDPPFPDTINFRRIELIRDVMVQHGDANTPVYITESGWNDDPRWTNAVRPGQRITYTLQAFEMVEDWPWAERMCLWIFRQPNDLMNRRDSYFSLVSSDFYLKPMYEAVQAYARGWPNPYAAP